MKTDENSCYCENQICSFLLCPSISPKRIKLESCSWAQKKRLEILFPELIKFLNFQCGKIVKIKDQKCGFFIEARGSLIVIAMSVLFIGPYTRKPHDWHEEGPAAGSRRHIYEEEEEE